MPPIFTASKIVSRGCCIKIKWFVVTTLTNTLPIEINDIIRTSSQIKSNNLISLNNQLSQML